MLEEYAKEILSVLPKNVTDEDLKTIKAMKNFFLFGFCDMDLQDYDFSSCSLSQFNNINFNTTTILPNKNKLPKGFDTNYINKAIKKQPLKDKFFENECTLAVIDNPATIEHEIYRNAKIDFVPYQNKKDEIHFHFHGVLSNILLNYDTTHLSLVVYTHSWAKRAEDNLKSLKDVEKRIRNGEKIFAVSISDWLLDEKRISEDLILKLKAQIAKLQKLDCIVIDSQVASKTKAYQAFYNSNTKQIEFGYIGTQPMEQAIQNIQEKDYMLMKACPIYADCENVHGYVADFCPGWSWIIPQIAFLYCQAKVKHNIDFNAFVDLFAQSYTLDERNLKVFDFNKFKTNLKTNKIRKII